MAEEDTITFEFIREIHRRERADQKLSKIPEDFVQKAKLYLDQKEKLAKKKRDEMTYLEFNNAKRLLEEIFNRRETKLVNLAVICSRTGIPPQNLMEEEKEFFETLIKGLNDRRKMILSSLLKGSKTKQEFKKVEFTEEVPGFAGVDLKNYGPFKKNDVAKIPSENAELLVKVKKAKYV